MVRQHLILLRTHMGAVLRWFVDTCYSTCRPSAMVDYESARSQLLISHTRWYLPYVEGDPEWISPERKKDGNGAYIDPHVRVRV